MSSRTPEECIELAVDASASAGDREDAIRALARANECDELADLARTDDLEERYRRRALDALATPQCDSMLRTLVDEGSLDESVRGEAERLLDGTGDD